MGVLNAIGWSEAATMEVREGFDKGVRGEGKKIEGIWSINRGNVATFGLNVATFPRVGRPTSRR